MGSQSATVLVETHPGQRQPDAEVRLGHQGEGGEGAQHEHRGVGEVQDVQDAEDERVA